MVGFVALLVSQVIHLILLLTEMLLTSVCVYVCGRMRMRETVHVCVCVCVEEWEQGAAVVQGVMGNGPTDP